ncbi:hypothetical protein NDU88_002826 [Pleurodeles waltl]|uniref:Uncharacterized protein n=1 Tax=Pleurodeles waltl TaxID=8319 RepID=A0AAV7NEU6_PLEWA|nr:hypothetical protein NDU88_002826 [Pleurodeles waltl]
MTGARGWDVRRQSAPLGNELVKPGGCRAVTSQGCGREMKRGKRTWAERPAGAPTDPGGEPCWREASTTHEFHTEEDDAMHMSQSSLRG